MTRSTFPDVEIPNLSIYDFLFGSLTPEELEVTALVDGTSGAKTSYGQLVGTGQRTRRRTRRTRSDNRDQPSACSARTRPSSPSCSTASCVPERS